MARIKMYSNEYRLFTQEGHLTMSSLLGGLQSILQANIDDKNRGLFYSGLFELATGFERLFKIVLILDHMLKNECQIPTNNELRTFGHDIEKLYNKCSDCVENYSIPSSLEPTIQQKEILAVLAKFAKGSRYYNLDKLTEKNNNDDPILLWLKVINAHIWGLRHDVRKRLEHEALIFSDSNGLADSWQQNLDGEWVTTFEFVYLLSATEKANYHVVWSIISLLRPFYHILQHQIYRIHELTSEQGSQIELPHMYEFFSFFLTPKHIVLRKKKWEWGT